ncbi:MAG: hypothetical protein WKG01_31380 [Kofleriaceae bacterium]
MRSTILFAALVLAACGDDPPKSYDTYQDCFDDQTLYDMMPVQESIVACCFDHPIDGNRPVCQGTVPDCINFLTINLSQVSASPGEVRASCEEYIVKLEMAESEPE